MAVQSSSIRASMLSASAGSAIMASVTEGVCTLDCINSRLDEIQAAILRVLLPDMSADNARRRVHARCHDEALAPLSSSAAGACRKPDWPLSYHQYAIEVPIEIVGSSADARYSDRSSRLRTAPTSGIPMARLSSPIAQ